MPLLPELPFLFDGLPESSTSIFRRRGPDCGETAEVSGHVEPPHPGREGHAMSILEDLSWLRQYIALPRKSLTDKAQRETALAIFDHIVMPLVEKAEKPKPVILSENETYEIIEKNREYANRLREKQDLEDGIKKLDELVKRIEDFYRTVNELRTTFGRVKIV